MLGDTPQARVGVRREGGEDPTLRLAWECVACEVDDWAARHIARHVSS